MIYAIFEILLQLVFPIWFYIPVMYWAGNNILARVNSIQSGINLKCIPKTYSLLSKWAIDPHDKKQNISQARNQKYENI